MSSISLRDVLEDMTHSSLKNEVAKIQIRGYTTKSKTDLINAMLEKPELFNYLMTEDKVNKLIAKQKKQKPKKTKLNIPVSITNPKIPDKPLNLRQFGRSIDKLKSLIEKGKKTDKMPINDVIEYAQTLMDINHFINLNKNTASPKTKKDYKQILKRFPSVIGTKLDLPSSFYKAFE